MSTKVRGWTPLILEDAGQSWKSGWASLTNVGCAGKLRFALLYFSIYVHCDLDLWPVTSKNNKVYSLTVVNVSSIRWRSTRWFSLYRVHKLISIHINCDLNLWPLTFKIGSILSQWLTCLPSLMKKRTKLYLWPPKLIGYILSLWLTCMPRLIKKHKTVKSLFCSQAYFHICQLWHWPLTSDLQNQ